MFTVVVDMPEGPRQMPAHIIARNKLGELPATLRIPKPIPGKTLTRTETGWRAA